MSLLQRASKEGDKFVNPVPTSVGGAGMLFKVLPLYFNNKAEAEPKSPLGPFRTEPSAYATAPASGLRVTWFGHSSSLVEIDGARVLIDPVWDERASPFRFFGPKRFFAPTIGLEELPRLDVVLISHDHYDHLGAESVRRLARTEVASGATWVTSLGVGRRLRGFGVPAERIVELDWTESTAVGGLRITSWPARHFSGRGALDRFKTLWGSFVLVGPEHRVYYGADSGYWEGFAEIAAQYADAESGGFDLAMLEIGAFHPLWSGIHLGPENAARAFHDLSSGGVNRGGGNRGGVLMPVHWGLFNLALHGWREPIEQMLELADSQQIPLWLPEPGQPTEVLRGTPRPSNWWRLTGHER